MEWVAVIEQAIVVGLVSLAFSIIAPLVTWAGTRIVERRKKTVALQRVKADPLIFEGAKFQSLSTPEGVRVFGYGKILRIRYGEVLVASYQEGEFMGYTVQDFERMHKVWLQRDRASLK